MQKEKEVKIMQIPTKNDVQIISLVKRESEKVAVIYELHWSTIAENFKFKIFSIVQTHLLTSLSSL